MTRPGLTEFLRQNWPVVAVLVLSLVVTVWFSARFILDVIYFNDPAHRDVALQGWMTPRYITLSYDLPRGVVLQVLGMDEGSDKGRHLADIAAEKGVSLEELTRRVRQAADAHRAGGR
ncbi:hypothetical protein [Jannaschia sp. 2305UL9-9]|uniref:hypothetical protein n=1 Tax=Jannaschia sp. 2305UL9-9 TaxID=3121638 RepID=UPI003528F027